MGNGEFAAGFKSNDTATIKKRKEETHGKDNCKVHAIGRKPTKQGA
jgi:hypothetical protein